LLSDFKHRVTIWVSHSGRDDRSIGAMAGLLQASESEKPHLSKRCFIWGRWNRKVDDNHLERAELKRRERRVEAEGVFATWAT